MAAPSSPESREITFCTVGGRDVPAQLLVCNDCHILDLNVCVDTSDPVEWKASSGCGHSWSFIPPPAEGRPA